MCGAAGLLVAQPILVTLRLRRLRRDYPHLFDPTLATAAVIAALTETPLD